MYTWTVGKMYLGILAVPTYSTLYKLRYIRHKGNTLESHQGEIRAALL